jgi:branched-chain amino acid transport system substrate-binding protein
MKQSQQRNDASRRPLPKACWALLAVLVLLAAACGGDGGKQATGDQVNDQPIVIGAVFDLSGPTSDAGVSYAQGIRDYVDWRNDHGGVEGRRIDLRWQDYKYDASISEQLYTQFVADGAVAFQGWGTKDTEALRGRVAEDEIPFMSASYAATLTDPKTTPYNFVVALSYSNQLRIALRYIAEQNKDRHVEVAVFHHDSPFGTSPLDDGRRYIRSKGLDIGYQTYVMPQGATDYVGELARAKQQGATYVIIQNTPKPAAVLAKNVKDQGINAQLFCLNWCADEIFIQQAGSATEGALGIMPFAPPLQANGEMEELEDALRTKGRSLAQINLHYTQGWYTMSVMAEGLAKVIASGKQITGPAIKEALETMDPVTTPVTTAIDFSQSSHEGMRSARVYQVRAGTWQPLSDALTP